MIRLQIVERDGAHLHRTLVDAMRAGDLRTFSTERRGRKVTHTNPNYPGWMNWSYAEGVISCEILSPRKPGAEWKLLSVQFPEALAPEPKQKRRRRRSR